MAHGYAYISDRRTVCMIPTIIIGTGITGYAVVVLCRKVKDMKNGKICGCECGSCHKGFNCKKRHYL